MAGERAGRWSRRGRPVNVAGQRPGGAAGRGTGSSGRVAGIVLAAGSSTRMGRNKLLLDLGGETVVRRAARTAIDAGLDPVVVVTGHAYEAVEAQLHVFALTTVVNTNHGAGQHTSVAAGIAALGGQGGRRPRRSATAAARQRTALHGTSTPQRTATPPS